MALSTLLVGSAVLACSGDGSDFDTDHSPRQPSPLGGSSGAATEQVPPTHSDEGGASGGMGPGSIDSGNDPLGGSAGSDLGAGGGDVAAPAIFCDAPRKVLMASCGNGSCHSNSGATIGDFAVDPERAYHFVDKLAARDPECGFIIDSRDYSQSFLLLKVRGDFPVPQCGERMPVGSFKITEEQIDCLASWLQQFQH
jgi:hypothetical protein